jgi:hypothetical protein
MKTHRKAPQTFALPTSARAAIVARGLVSHARTLATKDGAVSLLDAPAPAPEVLPAVDDDTLCDAVITAVGMRREATARAARVARALEISREIGIVRGCYPATR